MKNIRYIYKFLLVGILIIVTSCNDEFLDTEPSEIVSEEQLSTSTASNEAIVRGVYAALRSFAVGDADAGFHIDYGLMSTKNATDMMSHDVTQPIFHWYIFYLNYDGRVQTSSRARLQWNTYYSQILSCNTAINALEGNLDDDESKFIMGQALALRSLSYHYLIRMFAKSYSNDQNALGIPIYDGTTFDGQPRSSVGEVYNVIVNGLEEAVTLLEGFQRETKQTIDQNVAYGLLAEVYLDMGRWADAEIAAQNARQGYSLMSGEEWLQSGFSNIANNEWLWGADIDSESSTVFASFFSHFDSNNNGYAGVGAYKLIDANLYSLIPDTDLRKQAFIDPVEGSDVYPDLPGYANLKFQDPTFFEGDYVYMRVAEMYLIEAEAKARQNKPTEAAEVLFELVSTRDEGYTMSDNTGEELIEEIYLQRRIELWGEGFAWFDLKRLQKGLERDYPNSNHLTAGKFNLEPGAKEFVFQIPEDELNANDQINSGNQNP